MVVFRADDGAAVGARQAVDTQDGVAFAIGIPHAGGIAGGEEGDAWLAERRRQMHDACVMAEIAVAFRHDGGGDGQRTACDERSMQVVLLKRRRLAIQMSRRISA